MASWLPAHLLGLAAGSPAVAQWGLVPCSLRGGEGALFAAKGGNAVFNPHATVSPVCACGNGMAHAQLPEETKGTARTRRGCL